MYKRQDQSNSDFSVNKDQENKFKTSAMYPVLDFIMGDIKTRYTTVSSIHDLFALVLNFMDMENDELEFKVKVLVTKFKKDLGISLKKYYT